MKLPIPELIIGSLMAVAMISTESGGGIAGMINISAKTGEHFTGTWLSYSPTRFGAMSAEFSGNGACQFRGGGTDAFPCKWHETENGRAKIEATVSGRAEIFSATVTGDYLLVMDPGRETPYVRADSKSAHERQKMVRGPSSLRPW